MTAEPLRFRILFVDDEVPILNAMKRLMRQQDYHCWFASSAADGIAVLEQHNIDLVISDMRMPVTDGASFLAEVRSRWPFSVRFLMTGYSDMNATLDALNLGGINRYISKPWDDAALLDAIAEGLRIRRLEREKKRLLDRSREQNRELESLNQDLEERVARRTLQVEATSAQLKKAFRQLENSYDAFVRIFSSVIASRPHLIRGHSREVADLASQIAQGLALDQVQVRYIYYAALLHELGKLNLPDDILSRSEVHLTHRDQEQYQRYPLLGEMALLPIKALRSSAQLIRHHNEHYDGSGYPDGLKGQHIPLGSRIIKVSRDFVGLQTDLLRKTPLAAENAFQHLLVQSAGRYDPQVLDALQPLVADFSFTRMQHHECQVTLADLQSGMVLTRDLVSASGILLMVKDSPLSAGMIRRLQLIDGVDNSRMKAYVDNTPDKEEDGKPPPDLTNRKKHS
ncbi:MAG: response regulator [Halomonadaceae bacterium]|nr:MAG: response regulator [Halomonadaceae bacterium]